MRYSFLVLGFSLTIKLTNPQALDILDRTDESGIARPPSQPSDIYAAHLSSLHPLPGAPIQQTHDGSIGIINKRAPASTGDFKCGPSRPCSNGACCGKEGWCGYGDTYCGKGCQSNCDAKAECGQYASTANQTCPLNVCCSEFGFCGTTSDFCGKGCQSHCEVPTPKFHKTNTQKKIIGYYEAWSMNHTCGKMEPGEIPIQYLTHLNFAFGFIRPGDFEIVTMPGVDARLFGQVTDLKKRNPNLKVMIALGGWTFNDPGNTQTVFSDLVSSEENRQKFIRNLMAFMSQYGFDGVDLDWEYPGASDRGGRASDGVNFTRLLQEIKAAFGRSRILTFTAPTSYWYLRHFDIKASSEAADWINLMSYDLHGVWDQDNPIGSQVLAHTNITEIDLALELFWRTNVEPNKIVLGVGFYGRSFKLSNPSCWKPGCQFAGPGAAGRCTQTKGILSYKEIQDVLASTKAKPYYDSIAKVQYIVYDQDNWISFDDARTFQDKIDFANHHGLSGLMIWAVDIDDDKGTAIRDLTGDRRTDKSDNLAQFLLSQDPSKGHVTDDPSQCYITDCNKFCDPGWTAVGRCNTDKDGKNRCPTRHSELARRICCPSFAGPRPDQCRWDDSRSSALHSDCSGKCNIGEIELVDDSFGWTGAVEGGDYGDQCGRGYKVFCCQAGNVARYLDICTWTPCNEGCPSDKQHVLTTDTGGPRSNPRCKAPDGGPGGGSPFDPEGSAGVRKLCCPKADSFKNCGWKSSRVCSNTCEIDQITLDLDPRGPNPDGHTCDNGRQQAFCCDPPGGIERPFTPFNLESLFPPEYLPPPDAIPSYDIISFGGAYASPIASEDPNLSGLAFFLIAGSSTAVTSMKKRDNPGLHFLSCPPNVLDRPNEEHQTARVICLSPNVEECFQVKRGGVEGTVVQMPDECGGPSFARAVSLEPSQDQSVPFRLAKRRPTSAVYDFTFDYNIDLIRRDAGDFSIRLDYSNVPGYWSAVVNSTGSETRERPLRELVQRFYGHSDSWYDKYNAMSTNINSADHVNIDLKHLIYDDEKQCPVTNGSQRYVDEGISVGVLGNSDVDIYYGFSLIATWNPGSKVQIHEAAGFVRPEGMTDATFKVGGQGGLDTAKSFLGETLTKTFGIASTKGHNVFKGWAWFQGYQESGVKLRSHGGQLGVVSFDGYMEARIRSEWGRAFINFPIGAAAHLNVGTGERERRADQVSASPDNNLTALALEAPGGSITVSSTLRVGLQVGMSFSRPWEDAAPGELPDMSVSQEVFARFNIKNTATQACLNLALGTKQQSHLARGSSVGWPEREVKTYVQELAQPGSKRCFDLPLPPDLGVDPPPSALLLKPRSDSKYTVLTSGDAHLLARQSGGGSKPGAGQRLHDVTFGALSAAIRCQGCGSCVDLEHRNTPCCGCACLICKYGPVDDVRHTSEETGSVSSTGTFDSTIKERDESKSRNRNSLPADWLSPFAGLSRKSSIGPEVDKTDSLPLGTDLIDVNTEELFERRSSDFERRPGTCRNDNMTTLSELFAPLEQRAPPATVTRSDKFANFCNTWVRARYPSYPDMNNKNTRDAKKQAWDTNNQAQQVLQYFHNTTSNCLSWAVGQFGFADTIYRLDDHGRLYTQGQFYQTEHIFEAQTLGRFLETWMPASATNTRDCAWIRSNLADSSRPWPGAVASLSQLAMNELGSYTHLDRLAVFLTDSNRLKGQIFLHNFGDVNHKFDRLLPGDEQITYLKNFGMIFPYMNHPTIWSAFCASYEGVYALFLQWDNANSNLPNPPNLHLEWQKFVRAELQYVVTTGRVVAIALWNTRKPVPGLWDLWWRIRWGLVMAREHLFPNIAIAGSCPNLPPI